MLPRAQKSSAGIVPALLSFVLSVLNDFIRKACNLPHQILVIGNGILQQLGVIHEIDPNGISAVMMHRDLQFRPPRRHLRRVAGIFRKLNLCCLLDMLSDKNQSLHPCSISPTILLTSLPSALPFTCGIRCFITGPLSRKVGAVISSCSRTLCTSLRISSSLISAGANSL